MEKNIDIQVFKSIASLSKFYKEGFLKNKKNKLELLLNDFWEANLEFIRSLFPRGRRDELSFYYSEVGMCLIKKHFGNNRSEIRSKLKNFDAEERGWLNEKLKPSDDYEKKYREEFGKDPKMKREWELTNSNDKDMIISALNFISNHCRKTDYNIYLFSKRKLENDNLEGLFKDLNSIKQVGPKLSSLFMRDLILLFFPEHGFKKEDLKYLFPVDTWVRQIAIKTGICDKDADDEQLIREIVEFCHKEKIDVMDFNAGSWYLGSQPFRLFFEHGLINQVKNIV